jgi:hypothetical protein
MQTTLQRFCQRALHAFAVGRYPAPMLGLHGSHGSHPLHGFHGLHVCTRVRARARAGLHIRAAQTMSITALVTGRLIADPERRTGTTGKPFTLAKIAAATDDGDALVSVIAFGTAGEQLAALTKGDTLALTGRAKVNTWSDREGNAKAGLSVTADALLTAYHLRRKRAAMMADDGASPS